MDFSLILCGEKKFYRTAIDAKRVFGELANMLLLQKKWNKGRINIVNPFRASMVLGTPGSGKSYAIVNNYIKQQIEKGFAMYIYDYKFPDL